MDSRPPTWRPAHLPKPVLAAQPLGLGVAGLETWSLESSLLSCNQAVMPLALTHRAAELTTDGASHANSEPYVTLFCPWRQERRNRCH